MPWPSALLAGFLSRAAAGAVERGGLTMTEIVEVDLGGPGVEFIRWRLAVGALSERFAPRFASANKAFAPLPADTPPFLSARFACGGVTTLRASIA